MDPEVIAANIVVSGASDLVGTAIQAYDSEVPLQVWTGAWAGLNLVFLNLGVGGGRQ